MMPNIIPKAKEFASLMHAGQKRKEGIPFIIHPKSVARILEEVVFEAWPHAKPTPKKPKYEIILSVAWLHDVLEDTPVTYDDLKINFGKDIADMVYLLSRNVNREEYKTRIKNSDYTVKIIKLADTLHNVYDPYSLSYLSPASIQRKIDDCLEFYIPLAMEVCPIIGCKLIDSIDNFLKFSGGYEK